MIKTMAHPPMIDKARIGFVRNSTFAEPKIIKRTITINKEKSVFTVCSRILWSLSLEDREVEVNLFQQYRV